jgi:hypothetical protein
MNANYPKAVGLSARQKINFHFNNFFPAFLILLVLLLTSVASVNGQLKESKKAPPNKNSNDPKVDIKASRRYDDKGNIIGYDSTYSSYYSNIQGDIIGMRNVMKNHRHFDNVRPWRLDDKAFSIDSTRSPNFFGNDFFLNVNDYFQKRYNTSWQRKELKKVLPNNGDKPKVDIKVNRHCDDKGKVIGYDSTNCSYYSSVYGDTLQMQLMKNFGKYFGDTRTPFSGNLFDTRFLNDSIMAPNFFRNHDFHLDNDMWHKFFDDMTHRLDSLKNGFFHEDHKRKYRL